MADFDTLTEREILIKQGEIIKTLCINFNAFKDSNDKAHKTLTEKLDKVTDEKVSRVLFFWVLGFIIISLITLTAYTGTIKNDVVKNTTKLEAKQ